MGWSVKTALGAVLVSLAVMTPASDVLAATPTDRLERFWQNAYSSRARVASDEAQIPLMAKADADECYGGIGTAYMDKTGAACPQGRVPKVNQAYVWGLTKTGSDLWFGTAPNVICLVFSGYLGVTTPIANDSWSCQFGQSPFASTPYLASYPAPVKARLGDWRPSKLYRYRQGQGTLEDLTAVMPQSALTTLNRTLGIRSAGSLGDTVLFAGPGMTGGLNVFAFDAKTGAFVSATTLAQYDNIRRFVVADGHLYTAVGKAGPGGALLRWTGGTTFVNVGNLPAEGADLAEHQGRIYVTTWPEGSTMAGLYMSPKLVAGGLPDAAGANLEEVWNVADYEPDHGTAETYGGGALASYDGRLIWGTMHVPFTAALNHFDDTSDTSSPANAVAAVAGTWRAVAIFSADKLDKPAERDIDLLYGSAKLPAWDDVAKTWRVVPNEMHAIPQLGESGFDDPFNNYTWAMGQTKSGLYIGTMDWSYVFSKALPLVVEMISGTSVPASVLQMPSKTYGADLMKITSIHTPAVAVSRTGVGNYTNYGVRTMVAEPDTLYLGTANPMNMLTVPDDDVPEGGWELRRIGPGDPLVPATTPAAQPPAAAPGTAPQAAPTASAPSTSKCVARNRRFHMHLGLRLKAATAKGMKNVRSVTAKVNGKAVGVRRTSLGLVVPVDLRGVTKPTAEVAVVLRLKKAIRVQRRDGGTARTTRIARTYVFTTCS